MSKVRKRIYSSYMKEEKTQKGFPEYIKYCVIFIFVFSRWFSVNLHKFSDRYSILIHLEGLELCKGFIGSI